MERVYRLALLALYQLSLLAGIALFPLAVAARRAGVRLPIDRILERVGTAYQRTGAGS